MSRANQKADEMLMRCAGRTPFHLSETIKRESWPCALIGRGRIDKRITGPAFV